MRNLTLVNFAGATQTQKGEKQALARIEGAQ